MQKNIAVSERIPKFTLLAGIGAILVYLLSSFPFIFLVATIKITNLYSTSEFVSEKDFNDVLQELTSDPWILVGGLLIQAISLFVYAFALSKIRGTGNPLNDFGIRFSATAWLFIPVGIALQLVGLAIGIPLAILAQDDKEQAVVTTFRDANGISYIVLLLLIAFVIPVAEEICFRGIFQRGLGKLVTPFMAAFIAGTLFAGVHLLDFGAFIGMTTLLMVGFTTSALTMYRGRIDASICVHVGFNLTTAVLLFITR